MPEVVVCLRSFRDHACLLPIIALLRRAPRLALRGLHGAQVISEVSLTDIRSNHSRHIYAGHVSRYAKDIAVELFETIRRMAGWGLKQRAIINRV